MKLSLRIGDRLREVEWTSTNNAPDQRLQGQLACRVDAIPYTVDALMLTEGVLSLLVGGRQYRCTVDGDTVAIDGEPTVFEVVDLRSLVRGRAEGGVADATCTVKAPMPGRIVRVLVSMGDQVEAQQGLVVIEAMKMQNELRSPKAGRVTRVAVLNGETVQAGGLLIVVE